MSKIDLADARVFYEGQHLPAIRLISKLQTQLLEAADRMAAIASALGYLQSALLNSNTVDVKLTLSKEDYGRFRAMGGMDDSERVRKAVMAFIHPDKADISPGPVESLPIVTPGKSVPASLAVEFMSIITNPAEPFRSQNSEPQPVESLLGQQSIAAEPAIKKNTTTKCPRCQSMIDLPEVSKDQWYVEIQCRTCGAKYLVKSQTVNAKIIDT